VTYRCNQFTYSRCTLYRTTWVICHQEGKTILDLNKARYGEVAVASAGPYANHFHLTPDR